MKYWCRNAFPYLPNARNAGQVALQTYGYGPGSHS
jgi:hypothetical protein